MMRADTRKSILETLSGLNRQSALCGVGRQGSRTRSAAAFTLLELVVVIATCCLLIAAMLPTFARSGLNAKAFQCLENNRRLCAAWRIYADDSQDRLVYSSDDGSAASNPLNQYAWTWSHLDFDPSNTKNYDTNADIVLRPLWPYAGRIASLYRCPSDPSYVVVNGVAKPRVRSFSMNVFLGAFAGTDGGYGSRITNYRLFLKMTDLSAPGPSMTFVFLDERPDVINWGNFMTDMNGYPGQPSLYAFDQDVPGMFHKLGGTFSFADGHTEVHRWLDPRTTPAYRPQVSVVNTFFAPNSPDVAWVQAHSTVLK